MVTTPVRTKILQETRKGQKADTLRRVLAALEELQAAGSDISFYSVAEQAQVSRSTLYRREDIKELVIEARRGHLNMRELARQASSPLIIQLEEMRLELDALRRENARLASALRENGEPRPAGCSYAVIQFERAA